MNMNSYIRESDDIGNYDSFGITISMININKTTINSGEQRYFNNCRNVQHCVYLKNILFRDEINLKKSYFYIIYDSEDGN